jgi:uncharacterized membrane protein
MMSIGPIQLLAITFDTFEPTGSVLPALQSLMEIKAIRLIDLQFLRKTQAGHVTSMEMSGLSPAEAMEFGSVIRGLLAEGAQAPVEGTLSGALEAVGQSYGLTFGDVKAVAERMRPGTAAALLLIEHTWATDFAAALREAGGKLAAQGFLTRDALMMVGAELEAQVEACEAVLASESVQAEAAAEAAEAVAASQAIQAEAARQALRALVRARLIEEAAIEEATEVVAAALAVEKAAITSAERSMKAGEDTAGG